MEPDREKILIEQVLGGNQDAFRTLVKEYERLVLHIVTPLIGISEDREDICQEVFIKVYKGLKGFNQTSRLSTWIGAIAYNTSLNVLRKKKKHFSIDLAKTSQIRENNIALTESAKPEENLIKEELNLSISEAVNKLPGLQRVVVLLFHYEELSLKEIGKIIDAPENTVKSYLFRGRKKLKELIKL